VIPALLTALGALFSAVGKLFEFLYARDLVNAGKVQEQLDALRKQVKDAQIAVAAREAIRATLAANPDSVSDDDPFRRD
jgi:hypothetical protein